MRKQSMYLCFGNVWLLSFDVENQGSWSKLNIEIYTVEIKKITFGLKGGNN